LGVPDPLAQGDPIRFMKIEGSQIKSRAKDNAEDVASGSGIGGKPANHLGGKLSAIVERNMLGMEQFEDFKVKGQTAWFRRKA